MFVDLRKSVQDLDWSKIQILFKMFGNFGRIYFQAALVAYFFKKRILNKQGYALQLLYISENIKAGRFSSCDKVFI